MSPAAGSTPAGQRLHSARSAELNVYAPVLPYNHTSQQPALLYRSTATASRAKLWLKLTLVGAGLLSLAQLAVAIWLKLCPVTFSVDVLTSDNDDFINSLPVLANVTTYLLEVWASAAVGLAGLWLWERKVKDGGATAEEMAACGGLVSSQTSVVVMRCRQLRLWTAGAYLAILALVIAASSAIVSAVTPTATQVSVAGRYSVPLPTDDGGHIGSHTPFDHVALKALVVDAVNTLAAWANLSTVSVAGAVVATADLGVANPGVLQSFTSNSSYRGPKYGSERSFVEASMCMPGITAQPAATRAATRPWINVLRTRPDDNSPALISLNYTNACGEPVESLPLDRGLSIGVITASTCSLNNASFVTWVATGDFTAVEYDDFPWNASTVQFDCAMNLAPAAARMRLYRRNGQTGLERVPGPPCPPAEADLGVAVANVSRELDWMVAWALEAVNGDLDLEIEQIGLNATGDFQGLDVLGAGLAAAGGLAYRALFTGLAANRFAHDAQGYARNYGGNASVGRVVTTDEVYTVTALGQGRTLFLVPLFGAVGVIVLSFGLVCRPVGVFDPSDAEAVAAATLRAAAASTEAGLARCQSLPGRGKPAWGTSLP